MWLPFMDLFHYNLNHFPFIWRQEEKTHDDMNLLPKQYVKAISEAVE